MKLRFLIVSLLFLTFTGLKAQNYSNLSGGDNNVITTAVPFMMIAPDARAGAMGDAGVSSSPDVYSMHWNPAKYAELKTDFNLGLSYSPWLRNLVPDMSLAYLAVAKKIDAMSTVAATIRYFTLGDINFTDIDGNEIGTYSPNEWAIDATYARKLTDNLSGAVSGRFIFSNLTQGQVVQGAETAAGWSIASDVAIYWQKDVNWFPDIHSNFAWGVNISNIGAKLGYNRTSIKKDFIPTNLRFGPSLKLDIDEYNTIAFSLDINKLLVPTPPIYADSTDEAGNLVIMDGKSDDVAVVKGIFQSFADAPGGFSEEMRELTYSLAVEYWYNKVFAIRGGGFYEDKNKGNRKFMTLGAGLRYNVFALDFSYLIPVNSKTDVGTNPLQNTLRFALTFNLGE